jgi:3-methyladenine DNA glycosylase AlkD
MRLIGIGQCQDGPVGRYVITAKEIVEQLRPLGKDSYRKVLFNHGIQEPCFGVKIEELKKIQKRIGTDYQLALDLYDTGIYDAMYLAGLIADTAKMTSRDFRSWIEKANCGTLSEHTVPGIASRSKHGHKLAMTWIDSKQEHVAAAGWATLSHLVAVQKDSGLDTAEIRRLLQRVESTIHQSPNRVRYVMNSFVIAVGSHLPELTKFAIQTAAKVGRVSVDMGKTACKVPSAQEYIKKVQMRGGGVKRKSAGY